MPAGRGSATAQAIDMTTTAAAADSRHMTASYHASLWLWMGAQHSFDRASSRLCPRSMRTLQVRSRSRQCTTRRADCMLPRTACPARLLPLPALLACPLQLKDLKVELGGLRVAKVTGGAPNKLSKM